MTTENPTPENPEVGTQENETPKYTQEQLDAFTKAQREEFEKEKEEGYKGIQRVLSEREREIEQLKSRTQGASTAPTSNQAMLELMEKKARDEGDTQMLADISAIKVRTYQEQTLQSQQKKAEELRRETESERGKVEARIKEAGLDPNDDTLDGVWDAFRFAEAVDGKWEVPNKRLDKVLSKTKKPVADETKETEEQMRERHEREFIERNKLNMPERAIPSGKSQRSFTRAQIDAMPFKEFQENQAEINRARREERLKD